MDDRSVCERLVEPARAPGIHPERSDIEQHADDPEGEATRDVPGRTAAITA